MDETGRKALIKPGIAQVSALFSVVILLFLFIGYRVQEANFYSGILITEFGLILLPAYIYLLIFRYDLRYVLRLKATRPLNFFIVFFIMLFAIPVAGVFNLLNLFIVNSIFGKVIVNQPPVATNGKELILYILLIAGSAGLCEEFLFRGVIQRGFERLGKTKAILLAAFLFSLTHMDFQKIFGTFLLGALIGFIVYRTGSLFCGMFAHFTNNAIAVFVSFLSVKFLDLFGGSVRNIPKEPDLNGMLEAFRNLSPQQLTVVLYIYGFLFLILATIFILLLFALIKLNPAGSGSDKEGMEHRDVAESGYALLSASQSNKKGLLLLLPGVLLVAGIYYFEVYKFTGTENGLLEMARRLLGI